MHTYEQAEAIAARVTTPTLGALTSSYIPLALTEPAASLAPSLFERIARRFRGASEPAPVKRATTEPLLLHFEPPHFEGRTFVFLVDRHDGVRRVAIDADTLKVTVELLGTYPRSVSIDPNQWPR